jgi:hypothetical protein
MGILTFSSTFTKKLYIPRMSRDNSKLFARPSVVVLWARHEKSTEMGRRGWWNCTLHFVLKTSVHLAVLSFLRLGATARGELWPPFFYILQPSEPGSSYADVHPSEADCLVSEQFSFYGVRLLASRPTPNPQPPTRRTRVPSSSDTYSLTCPAWVTLPVATLPPA